MEDRKRSRRYPADALPQCLDWVREIKRQLGSGGYNAEAVAEALGSISISGTAKRKIAALGHFGLLVRDGGKYALSNLAVRILNPTSEDEEMGAIREAFLTPELYQDLVVRYEPEGRVPDRLANILLREFEILDGANESVARDFVASGQFAGVLDEQGRFTAGDQHAPENGGREQQVADRSETPSLPQGPEIQHIQLQLIGSRTAQLAFPLDLRPEECDLIQLQIETLKRQAEIRQKLERSVDEDVL